MTDSAETLASAVAALIRIVSHVEIRRSVNELHPGDARSIMVDRLGINEADYDVIETFAESHPVEEASCVMTAAFTVPAMCLCHPRRERP